MQVTPWPNIGFTRGKMADFYNRGKKMQNRKETGTLNINVMCHIPTVRSRNDTIKLVDLKKAGKVA